MRDGAVRAIRHARNACRDGRGRLVTERAENERHRLATRPAPPVLVDRWNVDARACGVRSRSQIAADGEPSATTPIPCLASAAANARQIPQSSSYSTSAAAPVMAAPYRPGLRRKPLALH